MKTWAFGGLAVAMAMVGACGASSSSGGTTTTGGHGGHSTTVSASHGSTSGTTGTGGSTGTSMDPCASGSDCTQCTDQMSCLSCNETAHPMGAMLLNDLLNCIFCTACYTVCESSQQMGLCNGAPAMKDACDTGTPSMPGAGTACGDANGGCAHCSQQMGASCYMANQACAKNSDCVAFDMAIQACPTM